MNNEISGVITVSQLEGILIGYQEYLKTLGSRRSDPSIKLRPDYATKIAVEAAVKKYDPYFQELNAKKGAISETEYNKILNDLTMRRGLEAMNQAGRYQNYISDNLPRMIDELFELPEQATIRLTPPLSGGGSELSYETISDDDLRKIVEQLPEINRQIKALTMQQKQQEKNKDKSFEN